MFKHPPRLHFAGVQVRRPHANQLVFKIDPSAGLRMILDAERADRPGENQIHLDVGEFAQRGDEAPTPYEVLFRAAMVGDSTEFTRQDGVEETWRILQPLLDTPPPVLPYARGSWGPPEADRLVAGYGGWRGPWQSDHA